MTQSILLACVALLSLLTGAVLAGWLLRPRVAAAATLARAESSSELATARESARLQAEERNAIQARLDAIQAEANGWRKALDAVSNERAQLAERAARVPNLEDRVVSLSAALDAARHAQVQDAERASRIPALELRQEELERTVAQALQQAADLREGTGSLRAELDAERAAHSDSRERATAETAIRQDLDAKLAHANEELARLTTQAAADREQFTEKLAFIEEAKRSLTDQFKNLANDILEEKGKRFAEQNQTNLGSLLDPLKQKLAEFQGKVEDVYVKEGKDRSALAEQVRQLMGLNQSLSEDAKNLTSALKGSNKTQGNWGELVLEQILESSGLRKGHEFHPQDSHAQEDGRRLQPDVIISLPEERSLVVDAKVSLNAYEACASADTDDERESALKRHMASIRSHIKNLSGKNYQSMYQLRSLDFTLMFIPIEPAFMMAVNADRGLFQEAWERNVLLVSPSTLMFVLRTVAHLWRQEAQNRNAQEIAKRGAELYDKLCGFTQDLVKVGSSLSQAKNSYDEASKKLVHGRGSVIRQAEMLCELGIKPSKALAPALLQLRRDDDELEATESDERGLAPDVPASETSDGHASAEGARPGRRVDPTSKLSRAREIVLAHIHTHEPREIKRVLVETLEVSPAVANTYFCQARDAIEAMS